MRIPFKLLVFFCLPFIILGNRTHHVQVSYNELEEMKSICYPRDLCEKSKEHDFRGIADHDRCSCHEKCSQYNNCCIDAPYRGYDPPMLECRSGYYFINKCPYYQGSDSIWKNLCEDEWNKEDDILKLAPVTSLNTSRTYKNIYCLKCHERWDNFFYWNLGIQGVEQDTNATKGIEDYIMSYDQAKKTWVATSEDKSVSIPVEIHFGFPYSRRDFPRPEECDSSIESDCHDSWTDEDIRKKCHAYTAVRYYPSYYVDRKFKNPHCAMCNNIDVTHLRCHLFPASKPPIPDVTKTIFSFYHFINVNKDGGDKVGQLRNCEENSLWDPYSKKCRKLSCAMPGYVLRNNRCFRPRGEKVYKIDEKI